VNRLPPEVIALCATFVSHDDPRPIVPLTHVCRYWRKAITSSPRNWASISSGWKGLVPLCLARAGAVNLTVNITVSEIGGTFLRALSPRVSRISHLSLTGYSSIEGVADDLPGFFTSPMPNLTSLELEQTTQPTEAFPSNETSTPPLFQNVSKLKSLHLTRTPLYPTVFSITSLVELKLVGYTTPFHLDKFTGFLHSNPNLEVVVLDIQFFRLPIFFVIPVRIALLARLRELSFTCADASDAKGLISSISFSRDTCLEVISSPVNQSTDLRWFLPSPPTKIRVLFSPITTIKYQTTPTGEFHLSSKNSRLSFRCSKTPFNLDPVFALFDTSTVREFHAKVHPCRESLFRPLSQLPALETLVLVDVTSFPSYSLDLLAEEPALCSSLKTIAFFDCNLNPRIIGELEAVVTKRKNYTAARLHRVVIVRRDGKLPDYKLLQRLRRFVPRVDVSIDEVPPDLP